MKKVISELASRVFTRENANVARVSASVVVGMGNAAANICAPLILVDSLGALINDKTITTDIWLNIFYYTLAYSAGRILPVINRKILGHLSANVSSAIMQDMTAKCFELPHDVNLTQPNSEYGRLVVRNYAVVEKIIPIAFGEMLPMLSEVIGVSILLSAKFDYRVALTIVATLSLYATTTLIGKRALDNVEASYDTLSKVIFNNLMGTLQRYEIAHQFNNISYEKHQANDEIRRFLAIHQRKHGVSSTINLFQSLISSAGFISGNLFSIYGVYQGKIALEDFLMISLYLTQFITPLSPFGASITQFNSALHDFEPILKFISQPSSTQDRLNASHFLPRNQPPSITFNNITFKYKDEKTNALENCTLIIPSGHKVALVGGSGSGKTTLIKLLQRFYTPDQGEILIDNHNISDITKESLRTLISVVSQQTLLNNQNIKEAIRYGDLYASDAEIDLVSSAAGLAAGNNSNLIAREDGGENGGKISGGQKQRVSLARAMLKGGLIFILDEATSALDPTAEAETLRVFDELTAGCTTLVITHRLNTILNADYIYYLSEGKISEKGTFQDLIHKKGEFYQQMLHYCNDLSISINDIHPRPRNKEMTKFSDWQVRKAREKLDRISGHPSVSFYQSGVISQLPTQNPNDKASDDEFTPLIIN
ncbi:MAG: ABC transporter ATP-binding protein/permease [Gammaproteobacteria bacterium]|nr:ABC transporter ATP-binding protein/permease [Gammaproteobacteria bacterium]